MAVKEKHQMDVTLPASPLFIFFSSTTFPSFLSRLEIDGYAETESV
jgi:hypothetical protein